MKRRSMPPCASSSLLLQWRQGPTGCQPLLPDDPLATKEERGRRGKGMNSLEYLRMCNTPPQFHMAQPNGIVKHLDSQRDSKLDRKTEHY